MKNLSKGFALVVPLLVLAAVLLGIAARGYYLISNSSVVEKNVESAFPFNQNSPPIDDSNQLSAEEKVSLKYFKEEGNQIPENDLPAVSLTFPGGGETLKIGDTHQITWSSSNASAIKYIRILITQSNANCGLAPCSTAGDVIIENTPNTGSFTWKVANISQGFSMPAGQYIISLQAITDYKVKSYQNGNEMGYSNYTATSNSGLVNI